MNFQDCTIPLNLNDLVWGSTHFKWGDVLYCPRWDVCPAPTDEQIRNITRTISKLEIISQFFDLPIKITNAIRPKVYNGLISGAPESAHLSGQAIDFVVVGMSCDDVRAFLESRLDGLGIRMEYNPGSDWVHIDTKMPGATGRYFRP